MHWERFALLYGLQIAITYKRHASTCQDSSTGGFTLYAIHHLLDVYLFWAPLFLETAAEWRVYLVVAPLVLIHWATNKNLCVATVVMNRRCGFPEAQGLDSLKNRVGVPPSLQFAWIGAILLYAYVSSSGKN